MGQHVQKFEFNDLAPGKATQTYAMALAMGAIWACLNPNVALAESIYPSVQVDRNELVQMPAEVSEFTNTVLRLSVENAFGVGNGVKPRTELGGIGAKAWLLSHVAPDFVCLSDFGGMCPETNTSDKHQINFLAIFATDSGDNAVPAYGQQLENVDLSQVKFETRTIVKTHKYLSLHGDMLCSPQATSKQRIALEDALIEWSGEDILLVLDRLRAVMGGYNIRSAPKIDAPTITTLRDPILYFPNPWSPKEEVGTNGLSYIWYEVLLPDGRKGYVAPGPGDLLDAGGLSEQVCFDVVNGRPRIRAHVGGGD